MRPLASPSPSPLRAHSPSAGGVAVAVVDADADRRSLLPILGTVQVQVVEELALVGIQPLALLRLRAEAPVLEALP